MKKYAQALFNGFVLLLCISVIGYVAYVKQQTQQATSRALTLIPSSQVLSRAFNSSTDTLAGNLTVTATPHSRGLTLYATDQVLSRAFDEATNTLGLSVSGSQLTFGNLSSLSLLKVKTDGTLEGITDGSNNWNAAYSHKTTEDVLSGIVKVNGSGTYSAITDNSTVWDGAASHKITEDALNGIVAVNGAGVYSAVTNNVATWNKALLNDGTMPLNNNTYLTGKDNAGTGTKNLIRVNTSDTADIGVTVNVDGLKQGNLTTFATSESVADDAEITLPSNTYGGWGFAQSGDNAEYCLFSYTSAGVVTLIQNSGNCVNTDTDLKAICIYDCGSVPCVKNRSGGAAQIKLEVKYN